LDYGEDAVVLLIGVISVPDTCYGIRTVTLNSNPVTLKPNRDQEADVRDAGECPVVGGLSLDRCTEMPPPPPSSSSSSSWLDRPGCGLTLIIIIIIIIIIVACSTAPAVA